MNPGPALPIVDVGAFSRSTRQRSAAIRAVTGALTRSGFMYVTGHGIDPLLIERAFAAMRGFFGQTHAFKARYAYRDIDANFGYQSAVPVQDAALINTGDLMERWTNGRFRSTVHRVAPIGGTRDRQSIALFVDPDAAVEVECFESCISADRPAQCPRITAGEHIRRKIAATNEGIK